MVIYVIKKSNGKPSQYRNNFFTCACKSNVVPTLQRKPRFTVKKPHWSPLCPFFIYKKKKKEELFMRYNLTSMSKKE